MEENNNIEQSVVKEEPPKKENKIKKGLVITLITIILIAAILVGTWYILNKDKDDDKISVEYTPNQKATEYKILSNGLENFDLFFLKLENGKTNKVYSPLSIKYTLEMLSSGATGETKSQIDEVLGKYVSKKYYNSENMSFANTLFIRDSYEEYIKQDYINTVKNEFGADVKIDSFETPDTLNNWVKEKTLNLIPKLTDDISSLDFILVNALGIDMEWAEKFDGETYPLSHKSHAYYANEKKPGQADYAYQWAIGEGDSLKPGSFENVTESISTLQFKATFNRYDIMNVIGEDNIRKTVRDEYRKYLDSLKETDYEYKNLFPSGRTETAINTVLDSFDYDKYVEEIGKNYGDVAYSVDFSFYTDDNVKVFAKDLKEYNGVTLQYVGIMPTNESLDNYITNVTADKINSYITNLKTLKMENMKDGVVTEITGYVPKFVFDYTLDLQKDLQELGIVNVFDIDKSELSNISNSAYISEVKHKANIEFTQYGIKAAAATMVGGRGAAGSWNYYFEVPFEEIDLTFNKPYMFIIRDKQSGEVWFAGTVYNPLLWNEDTTKAY